MYFVYEGDVLARYIGEEDWEPDDLPVPAMHYDYDDESIWTNSKLKKEAGRVGEGMEYYDEDASAALETEQNRRAGLLSVPEFDDWKEFVAYVEQYAEDAFGDDDRRPLVFPDELSLPTRKLIREVAKIEHEEIAFRKKNLHKASEDIDEATKKEFMELDNRGWDIREALLDSDLGDLILDKYDPVEDMKTMAAQMFFLYSQTRMKAEIEGGKPDEDLFYAGSNLYAHAVVDQIEEEKDDDEDDEDDEYDPLTDYQAKEALNEFWNAFGEYMAGGGPDDEFMRDMDASTEAFLKEKGFDITTLVGAKAAQRFLEKAGPEDAFVTEGPVDNEMDEAMGRMRLDAMLRCVKARIQKMISGEK